jgi:hypothetical protein
VAASIGLAANWGQGHGIKRAIPAQGGAHLLRGRRDPGISQREGMAGLDAGGLLEQEADQPSEPLGVFWGEIELVLELNKIATAPQKPKWLRACC